MSSRFEKPKCWCETCRPITMEDMRMIVCPACGNKRCPRATNHANACTNSNEVGQKGSSWERVKPFAVKPRIFFDNGRWHVLMEGWPIHGYLLLSSAFERARAIWKRGEK